jgi:hypothetical protein
MMFSSNMQLIAPVQNVNTLLCSRSDKRYRVVVISDSPSVKVYVLNNGIAGTTAGLPIPANSGLDMCVREYGYVVQDELWAFTASAGVFVGVLQVMACDCESEALLKDALGHMAGEQDWHTRQAMNAQGYPVGRGRR